MRRFTTLLLTTVLVLVSLAATGSSADSYTAPYPLGPSGGDSYNVVRADDDGRIVVGRASPVPGAISCNSAGGYATFEIVHEATDPVTSVTVDYSGAAVDPYVFVSILVIDDDGAFLGNLKRRGIIVADGSFAVPVDWPAEATHRVRSIRIQFGLELTTACPSADAGTMRFDAVTVAS